MSCLFSYILLFLRSVSYVKSARACFLIAFVTLGADYHLTVFCELYNFSVSAGTSEAVKTDYLLVKFVTPPLFD